MRSARAVMTVAGNACAKMMCVDQACQTLFAVTVPVLESAISRVYADPVMFSFNFGGVVVAT
jgi:hypothetical protein